MLINGQPVFRSSIWDYARVRKLYSAFVRGSLSQFQRPEVQAKEWYARLFGGANGKRWHYEATDLPGINMNFSSAERATAPTKGRMLDHIAFEITNLKAFCVKLEAAGVKLDAPYTTHADGIATAWLTDPWGTSIELTEGLRQYQPR